MKTIRIRGLVKTMNAVRAALAAGESPASSTELRVQIRRSLTAVDLSCRAYGLSPRNLPPPSRRAYEFLVGLDLPQGPIVDDAYGRPTAGISTVPLVNARREIQSELESLVQLSREAPSAGRQIEPRLRDLHDRVQDLASEVAILCDRAGVSPASLPDPSRRVYQWLSFLMEEERLARHLATLLRAQAVDRRVGVELFHLAGLYRATPRGDGMRLVLSEGFLDAPDEVLHSLVKVVLPYTHKRMHRKLINAFVDGESFRSTILSLELSGGTYETRPQGRIYDLEEMFTSLNARFFAGRLDKPRLTWNRTITHRDFGHYEPSADTVMISITLDSEEVPRFVAEYVLHHELLHKALGVRRVSGRRQVHTRQFQERERRFPRAAEAEAFLEAWARHVRRD